MVVVKRVFTLFRETAGKKLRTVLVSQNTLKNNGPRAGIIHMQLRQKVKFALVT